MTTLHRPLFSQARISAITLLSALLAFGSLNANAAVDLGEASVLSQQGQKLKVAVGYGSAPGEKIPVTRFSVVQIRGEAKSGMPIAENFTISQPEKRNIVFLQSRELVTAEKLQLVMRSADAPTKDVVYDLVVPPARAAITPLTAEPTKAAKVVKKRMKKPVQKTSAASPFKKATAGKMCPCEK